MVKIFRKLHLWLSVPFGLIVTLICFSGAMLVFESEITRQIKKNVYYVSDEKENPLPMDQLMETIRASLPDSVAITGVTVFKDRKRTYQVNLSKPMRASLFVDQYSGDITGKYERLGFFTTMFKLHRWLLDSANPHGEGVKIGKLLVGISTLIFVIVLISGVIIWWPRARKNIKRSLSISVTKGWKVFWIGLHVTGGMYALIIVLAMALTGLTWSFEWYRNAFYAVCGVEKSLPSQLKSQRENSTDKHVGKTDGRTGGDAGFNKQDNNPNRKDTGISEFRCWQKAYDEVKSKNPDSPQITITRENVSVALGNYGNVRASDRYGFNPRNGSVSLQSSYFDSNKADKVRGWIGSIHMGTFGGIFTRILWMLGALLGASLPLTGYYIWIKRLGKKKNRHMSDSEYIRICSK